MSVRNHTHSLVKAKLPYGTFEGLKQAVQSGKRYCLESIEEYQLEFRDRKWLALSANATQQ